MAPSRYELSDEQWKQIEGRFRHVPTRKAHHHWHLYKERHVTTN